MSNKPSSLPHVLYAFQFPYWKRPVVRQCFPQGRIIFVEKSCALPEQGTLILWGMRPVPAGVNPRMTLLRIEDGFLRSVGLGADLVRPISWIVDQQGIYYDATQPSGLEIILSETQWDRQMLSRAALLRKRVVSAGLTKYNVGPSAWQCPKTTQRIILVPGQVESDASLAFGAPDIRNNMALLQAVRAAQPDAYIVYKPHPDVHARLRAKGKNEDEAANWCNEIITNVSMGDLLMLVDEVHVITSLAGFEALLRNKVVVCYGQPFYAGWGLTLDIIPHPRRQRSLSLDELVAGALFQYPLYLSRDGQQLISPEQALDELAAWYTSTKGKDPWWRQVIRPFLRRIIGVR